MSPFHFCKGLRDRNEIAAGTAPQFAALAAARNLLSREVMLASGWSTSAAVVVESAPLWVVADMVQAGRYEVVLVLNDDQTVMGLLRSDAVLRLSPRLPEAPVRMLPLQRVTEVEEAVTLSQARDLLNLDASIDALLIEKPLLQGWLVLLRDVVLGAEPQVMVA